MKRSLLRLFQLAVTAVLLAWIFRDPELRAGVAGALRAADPLWIAIGVLVAGVGEVANIIRWGIFLHVQKVMASWWRITQVFMVGLFFNLFLFGTTGGDVVRVLYLSREYHTRKGAVFLTVVMDRVIGLVVLVVFTLLICAWRFEWLSQTPTASALLWFLIVFTVVATLVLAGSFAVSGTGILQKLPEKFPGREKLLDLAAAYNLFTRAWKETLVALALSVPVLFTFFGVFYCAARAYGSPASLWDIFSVMPVITVVTSFPISVGGLGVREKLFQNLLGDLAGVPGDVAVLVSLTGFVIYVAWSLIGAVFYMGTGVWRTVPESEIEAQSKPELIR